ncbi:MAG TPA: hypothetical protein VGB15_14680 [Longimicrobium sp.]|jgi:hypothetical protein
MHGIDAEVIELLRRSAKERGERIARQMEQVEALRRALWLRMDRLRDHHDHTAFAGAAWPAGDTREAAAPSLEEAGPVPAAVG